MNSIPTRTALAVVCLNLPLFGVNPTANADEGPSEATVPRFVNLTRQLTTLGWEAECDLKVTKSRRSIVKAKAALTEYGRTRREQIAKGEVLDNGVDRQLRAFDLLTEGKPEWLSEFAPGVVEVSPEYYATESRSNFSISFNGKAYHNTADEFRPGGTSEVQSRTQLYYNDGVFKSLTSMTTKGVPPVYAIVSYPDEALTLEPMDLRMTWFPNLPDLEVPSITAEREASADMGSTAKWITRQPRNPNYTSRGDTAVRYAFSGNSEWPIYIELLDPTAAADSEVAARVDYYFDRPLELYGHPFPSRILIAFRPSPVKENRIVAEYTIRSVRETPPVSADEFKRAQDFQIPEDAEEMPNPNVSSIVGARAMKKEELAVTGAPGTVPANSTPRQD